MQAVRVIKNYQAQAPNKTKKIVSEIIAVVAAIFVAVCLYRYAYDPLRKSSLRKEIANLRADLAIPIN